MSITTAQQQRTESLHIDFEVKFYTAAQADVTLTDITEDAAYSPDGSWTEITAKVDKDTGFSNPWAGPVIDWSTTVAGVLYDTASIATGRMLLCRRRVYSPASGWGSWHIWFCGFITDIKIDDDHQQGGEWSATVRSARWLLETADHPPAHVFGRANAASGGTATASSTLTSVVAEAGKGEFVGIPSVAATNAIDNNMDTLWISNLAPSMTEEVPDTHGGPRIVINEVYREPAGYDSGYRWIELYMQANNELVTAISLKSYGLRSQASGLLDFHDLGDAYTMMKGDHLILCADERKFRELYDAGSAPVVEWRNIGAWGVSGVDGAAWTYNPDGGWLEFSVSGITGPTTSAVRWGTGASPPEGGERWPGDSIVAPLPGQSFRRDPAGQMTSEDYDQASDWIAEEYPSPGRHHTATKEDWEWIAVDLGEYTWTFGAEVNDDATTITVSPDTVGLTNAGQIMTDDDSDVITYTGKTETTLTGVTGIAAGTPAHASGVGFGQYESGIKHKVPKLSAIEWKRLDGRVDSSATPAVPGYFAVWTSTYSSPNYPPTENWALDWTNHANKASGDMNQGYSRTINLANRPRARHILLVIKQMADGGRAKINELKAYLDTYTTGEGDIYLDGADIPSIVEHLLTDHYGWAAEDVITTSCEQLFVGELTTQKTDYVSILADLARRTGSVLRFSRGMDIHFEADPRFPIAGNVDTQYTFDRQAGIKIKAGKRHPDRVGQVLLKARNPSEERVYEVTYPQTANAGAVVRAENEVLVGSEEMAYMFAEAYYKKKLVAENITVTASAITDEWCRPPKRVALNWDADVSNTDWVSTARGTLFLVTGIDVTCRVGPEKRWDETVTLEQFIP